MKSILVIFALLFSTTAFAQEAPKCNSPEQVIARNAETIKVIEKNEGIKVTGPVTVSGDTAIKLIKALTGKDIPVTDLLVYKFGNDEVVVNVFVKGCEVGVMSGDPASFEAALAKVQ